MASADMITMIKLPYAAATAEFIQPLAGPVAAVAVAAKEEAVVRVYDAHGGGEVLAELTDLHTKPVAIIRVRAADFFDI